MKKLSIALIAMFMLSLAVSAQAMEGMDHSAAGHDDMKNFKHTETIDGVKAQFEVMDLASMNMHDDKGSTHHVMVSLMDADGQKITGAVGRVKVVGPDGKDQVVDLKDYSGILAANFKATEKGKYGIICLFKVGDKKRTAKFWWNHM